MNGSFIAPHKVVSKVKPRDIPIEMYWNAVRDRDLFWWSDINTSDELRILVGNRMNKTDIEIDRQVYKFSKDQEIKQQILKRYGK